MKFVKVEPNKPPYVIETDNCSLEFLQAQVGGIIQIVPSMFDENLDLIVNDEGKLIGLEPNRWYGDDVIFGNILVTAYNDEGETISLTEDQIERAMDEYLSPESFASDDLNPEDFIFFDIIPL